MLVKKAKSFYLGFFMTLIFLAILVVMFSPVFGGVNALKAADKLFNSISKGSMNYIGGLEKKVVKHTGQLDYTINAEESEIAASPDIVKNAGIILEKGLMGTANPLKLSVGLDVVLKAALADSDMMFKNEGAAITSKYGIDPKEAMFAWRAILESLNRQLNKGGRFEDAKIVDAVTKKAVELTYNYYGITPESAASKAGILGFSLAFYLFYTLWWGYSIYFLFEGMGLQMAGGKKKEV